eukprot:3210977-Prymnesium_polylepis.1
MAAPLRARCTQPPSPKGPYPVKPCAHLCDVATFSAIRAGRVRRVRGPVLRRRPVVFCHFLRARAHRPPGRPPGRPRARLAASLGGPPSV